MKHIFTLLMIVFSATLSAQTEQNHIPVSKSIVGIWRLIDENTMRIAWSYNFDGNVWINEKWIRLPLAVPTRASGVKLLHPGTQKQ